MSEDQMSHVPAPESTPEASEPESGPVSDRDAQDAREARYAEAILSGRWPNGDSIDGVTKRTAALIAPRVREVADAELAPLVARVAELEAERDRFRRALGTLVALKDGPRDDLYEVAKPAAWETARTVLYGESWYAALAAAGPAVSDGSRVSGMGGWFRETPESLAMLAEERKKLAASEAAVADGEGATSEAHDKDCESEFIPEAGAWTPCRCATRPTSPVVAPSATDEGGANQRLACAYGAHSWVQGEGVEGVAWQRVCTSCGATYMTSRSEWLSLPAPDAVPSGEATDGTTPTKEA